jgi:hypothetical protein
VTPHRIEGGGGGDGGGGGQPRDLTHGRTPLLLVCGMVGRGIDVAMVKLLCVNGADTSALDDGGRSALQLAILREDQRTSVDTVRTLLTAGAPVELPAEHGCRPLHHAVYMDSRPLLELLLDDKWRADAESRIGANNSTALQYACELEKWDAALSLVARGASLDNVAAPSRRAGWRQAILERRREWPQGAWEREMRRGAMVQGTALVAKTSTAAPAADAAAATPAAPDRNGSDEEALFDRTVEVVNLSKRKDLNGCVGLVQYFDTLRQRYVVELQQEPTTANGGAAADATAPTSSVTLTIAALEENLRLVSAQPAGFDILQTTENNDDAGGGGSTGGGEMRKAGGSESSALMGLLRGLALRVRVGELESIYSALESLGFDDSEILADPFAGEELTIPCLKAALLQFLGESKARAPGLAVQLRRALSERFAWPKSPATTTPAAPTDDGRDGSAEEAPPQKNKDEAPSSSNDDDDDDEDEFFDAEPESEY